MSTERRDHLQTIERMETFVNAPGWQHILITAERDIIEPLRAKALKNAALDPREQTGVVRALEAVKKLLYIPYETLAKERARKLDDVLPDELRKMFT